MSSSSDRRTVASGSFTIGGDLPVHRLGYSAMQLTGGNVWGEPADRDEAIRVLRRAVELGVTLIDTADAYGPYVNEKLIAEALHPYADDLVIATKGANTRPSPEEWIPNGRPGVPAPVCGREPAASARSRSCGTRAGSGTWTCRR